MAEYLPWDWHLRCPVVISNWVFSTLFPEDVLSIQDKNLIKGLNFKYNYAKDHDAEIMGGIKQGVQLPPVLQLSSNTTITDDDISIYLTNKKLLCEDNRIWYSTGGKPTTNPNPSTEQDVISGNQCKKLNSESLIAKVEELSPGFCRLELQGDQIFVGNEISYKDGDGKIYLDSEPFKTGVYDFDTGTLHAFPEICKQDVQHQNTRTDAWSHTYALRVVAWPAAAKAWITRKPDRCWPPPELIQTVQGDGCYLVPKANGTWEYSFPQAEIRLMNSLSPVQRHIYALLKIIYFQKLSCPRILQHHHLRSSFLRMCESIEASSWKHDQTTCLLMNAVERMLHEVISGEFPDYFIPQKNLLAGIGEDHILEIQSALADVRSEALNSFISYNLSFQMESNIGIKHEVFEPVLDVIQQRFLPEDENDCVHKTLVPFLQRCILWKISNPQQLTKEEAFEILSTFRKKFDFLLLENYFEATDETWHEVFRAAMPHPYWAVRLAEYTMEIIEANITSSFLGNLGCMYHALFRENGGDKYYEEKAKDTFERAMKEPDAGITLMADYLVFLINVEEWQEARKLVEEAIASEDLEECNTYDGGEVKSLHHELQKLACALNGQLEQVPAITHILFLSIMQDELSGTDSCKKDRVTKFKDVCDKYATNDYYSLVRTISYVLLGIALEHVGEVPEAKKAYESAYDNCNDDQLRNWLEQLDLLQEMVKGNDDDDADDKGSLSSAGQNAAIVSRSVSTDEAADLMKAIALSMNEQAISTDLETSPPGEVAGGKHKDGGDKVDEDDEDEQLQLALAMSMSMQCQ